MELQTLQVLLSIPMEKFHIILCQLIPWR